MCQDGVDFGRDLRLLAEMTITGNKPTVGAGREFYSALAHDEELFEKTVEFVLSQGIPGSVEIYVQSTPSVPSEIRYITWTDEVVNNPSGLVCMRLVAPLRDGEGMLLCGEILHRSREMGAAPNLRHAVALRNNQEKIPASWRPYELLIAGSIGENGSPNTRFVVVMKYIQPSWRLMPRKTGGGFGKNVRLLGIEQITPPSN